MGTISLSIPQIGQPDTTEDVKIQNNFTTLQTVINGNLDSTNIAAALAQSASVNQSGQTVKGAVNIAASESRSNVAYGTLTTPDQVTGIVLPVNGLIEVGFEATWLESVAGAARAAIFIGSNQLQVRYAVGTGGSIASTQAAATGSASAPPLNPTWVGSFIGGLAAETATSSSGPGAEISTGQVIGLLQGPEGSLPRNELNGTVQPIGGTNGAAGVMPIGGPCRIFAAPGTYTVSVQFKASSGSVTVSNRKLWVQAISFS